MSRSYGCRCYKRVLEKGKSALFVFTSKSHKRKLSKIKKVSVKIAVIFICENKITENNIGQNSEINYSKTDSANCNKVILVNLANKKEIKVKTLFDQEIKHF